MFSVSCAFDYYYHRFLFIALKILCKFAIFVAGLSFLVCFSLPLSLLNSFLVKTQYIFNNHFLFFFARLAFFFVFRPFIRLNVFFFLLFNVQFLLVLSTDVHIQRIFPYTRQEGTQKSIAKKMDDSKSTQRKLARNIYWKKRLFSFRYERNEEKKLKGAVRVVCFNLFSECSSMLFLYRRWNHAQREFSLINKMSNAVLSPIFRFEKLINTDDNFPRTRNRFGRELEKRCAAREKRMCVSVPVWTLSEQNNQMFVCGWCEGSSLLCKRKNKIIDNGKALP